MFETYKNRVIAAYQNKLSKSVLSSNLKNPTAAKLKKECLIVYSRTGPFSNDDRILSDFFGKEDDFGSFEMLIRHFDVDKFKPLNNFIHGRTTDPDDKHVELLAWLIDFRPRPYKFDTFTQSSVPPLETNLPDSLVNQVPKLQVPVFIKPAGNEKNKIFSVLPKWLLPILGLAVFLVTGKYVISKISNSNKACMYWATDHYEAIACDKKIYGKQSVALDTLLLLHFKKITKPDTITDNSLGKIWYEKTNNKLEFFTAEGNHPLHSTKKLKPVTSYLIHKYCDKQQSRL